MPPTASPGDQSEPARATDVSVHPPQRVPGLVAEDNLLVQQTLLHALSVLGFSAEVAADGSEAMQMLRRERYSFALLDVQMPGMGGIEVLLELRQSAGPNTQLPVVIMSGDEAERASAFQAGANEFLCKPIAVDLLGQTVRRLSGRVG
ncbi:MAG: response regulator [Novipirellula sp. JB048]